MWQVTGEWRGAPTLLVGGSGGWWWRLAACSTGAASCRTLQGPFLSPPPGCGYSRASCSSCLAVGDAALLGGSAGSWMSLSCGRRVLAGWMPTCWRAACVCMCVCARGAAARASGEALGVCVAGVGAELGDVRRACTAAQPPHLELAQHLLGVVVLLLVIRRLRACGGVGDGAPHIWCGGACRTSATRVNAARGAQPYAPPRRCHTADRTLSCSNSF